MLAPLVPPRRTAPDEVLADLARDGLALIEVEPSPERLVAMTGALGARVLSHPDSDADGVTTIEDRAACAAASAGFTRAALAPHTDRSGVAEPPDLLLTVCATAASSGGELLLVDGRAVYLDLAERAPDALSALTSPRSVLFGGADGHLGSVFTPHSDTVAVRLRLDTLVRFSPVVAPHVPTMRAAVNRHTVAVPAQPGAGYVLDNRRWLHGRRSYTGVRRMLRVTAVAAFGTICGGFIVPGHIAAASGRSVR